MAGCYEVGKPRVDLGVSSWDPQLAEGTDLAQVAQEEEAID
jgi:hypothetical protein